MLPDLADAPAAPIVAVVASTAGGAAQMAAVPAATPATPSRAMVVARALVGLPRPLGSDAGQRFDALTAALARGDTDAACALLPAADGPRDGDALVLLSAAVLADEALRRTGDAYPAREHLLHQVRARARVMMGRSTLGSTTCWAVPAGADDRTAAHVAALILGRSLTVCRPWLWESPPGISPFLIIGRDAHRHPAAGHPRCQGCSSFARIASSLALA